MKQFYAEIGANNIYYRYNRILLEELDKMSIKGSNLIDIIVASESIIEYVEGCKLLDYNEIICLDHWVYIIDINFEEYFREQLSTWDNINKVVLNPSRQSYRKKYKEYLEE